MEHMQSVNEIQTLDLPAFLTALEAKHGKKWIEKNFACMAILCEDGAGGMFRTMGNGSNANFMKVAHACIRSLAKIAADLTPGLDERKAAAELLRSIAIHIGGDFSREGVPDGIFKGVMEKANEEEVLPPSIDGITAP